MSLRAEQAYADWIRRFILFHKKRHPEEMGIAGLLYGPSIIFSCVRWYCDAGRKHVAC